MICTNSLITLSREENLWYREGACQSTFSGNQNGSKKAKQATGSWCLSREALKTQHGRALTAFIL